jgi:hypothetical protein
MKSERLENLATARKANGTVRIGGTLTLSFAWALLSISGQLSAPMASAQGRPAVELERAITLENVDGDLNGAIAAYQKIGADKSAPRDAREKALLQLAGCYEKLGQQQSEKVYEQIVRDFGDQPAASQAKTRLAAMKASERTPSVTLRKIDLPWTKDFGPGDTDGHHVVYRDAANGTLIYSDLSGNNKRVVFHINEEGFRGWFPSKDLSKVLLHSFTRISRKSGRW